MNLDQQFAAAVIEAYHTQGSGSEMLPMLLAQACVKVLRVTGAGISITAGLRVPLGASDTLAAQAEALQTTLGEGPCLDATATSEPLVADEPSMAARWPKFHRELLAKTPFRAVASIPLKSPHLPRFGALDLYSAKPGTLQRLSLNEVSTNIADPTAAILFDDPKTIVQNGTRIPAWMTSHPVAQRMNVWVAVGILIEHADLTNTEALAAIRAYANSHSTSLDDIADHIATQRLHPNAILP